MRHQCTQLSSGKHKNKKPFVNSRKPSLKNAGNEINKCLVITGNALTLGMCTRTRRDAQSVEIQPMQKAFSAPQRNFNVSFVTSLDTLLVFVIKGIKFHSSLEDQRLINCKHEQCMHLRMPCMASLKRVPVMIAFACNSKYSTHKPVSRRFPHHLT